MRVLNNTGALPPHYVRVNGEELEEGAEHVLFNIAGVLRQRLNKKNLIAVDLGMFKRVYYINKYKMPKNMQ